MTTGSPATTATPSRGRAVLAAGGLALALALAVGAPAGAAPTQPATQVGPSNPTTPGGGGIGEPPGGGGSTTTTTEAEEPTTTTTEPTDRGDDGPTATTGPAEAPAVDDDAALARTGDDDGTSVLALAAVGVVAIVVGLLAGLGVGLALGRKKAPAAPSSAYAPGTPGAAAPPAPASPAAAAAPATPSAGPVIGAPPSRDEAQVRGQRAELAEALMALRDQVPSEALAAEAARALASVGIVEVRPDGQPFDPALHRAVDQVATDDPARHNTIVSTERPGYADGERLVRQPEVVVARHGGQP